MPKLISSVILLFACAAVFLIITSMPDNSMFKGHHLSLLIIYLPLFSAAYGIALAFVTFMDCGFLITDAVIFLGFGIAGAFMNDVYELPAAFAYTGIMLAFTGITAAVKHLIGKIRKSRK